MSSTGRPFTPGWNDPPQAVTSPNSGGGGGAQQRQRSAGRRLVDPSILGGGGNTLTAAAQGFSPHHSTQHSHQSLSSEHHAGARNIATAPGAPPDLMNRQHQNMGMAMNMTAVAGGGGPPPPHPNPGQGRSGSAVYLSEHQQRGNNFMGGMLPPPPSGDGGGGGGFFHQSPTGGHQMMLPMPPNANNNNNISSPYPQQNHQIHTSHSVPHLQSMVTMGMGGGGSNSWARGPQPPLAPPPNAASKSVGQEFSANGPAEAPPPPSNGMMGMPPNAAASPNTGGHHLHPQPVVPVQTAAIQGANSQNNGGGGGFVPGSVGPPPPDPPLSSSAAAIISSAHQPPPISDFQPYNSNKFVPIVPAPPTPNLPPPVNANANANSLNLQQQNVLFSPPNAVASWPEPQLLLTSSATGAGGGAPGQFSGVGNSPLDPSKAPKKAAGDVSLTGPQLLVFLQKATMKLQQGPTREGIGLRIAQFGEQVQRGQLSDHCLKKLNFVVDALDRDAPDEAWQFYEQMLEGFPVEMASGWAHGIRILIQELLRSPGGGAGNAAVAAPKR